jgi:hypothetical protein
MENLNKIHKRLTHSEAYESLSCMDFKALRTSLFMYRSGNPVSYF